MAVRKNNFILIRLLAAFLVMAGHMYVLVGHPVPVFCFSQLQSLGIKIFFCIGGYLITESWKRDPCYHSYLIKRILRIFPALIVCVLVTAYVIGPMLTTLPFQEYVGHPQTFQYLKNAVLYVSFSLPGVFEGNPYPYVVNGSLWSLPVEFFMYLMIPWIYETGKYRKGYVHVGETVLICGISIWKHFFYPAWDYVIYHISLSQALEVIPYYFLGSLAATKDCTRLWNIQIAAVTVLIAQCLTVSEWVGYVSSFLLIPYAVFSLAFCDMPVSEGKVFQKCEISYGLYLYAFCIQQGVISLLWGSRITDINVVLGISLAVTAGVAWMSAKLVEKPARQLQRQLLQRRFARLGKEKRG